MSVADERKHFEGGRGPFGTDALSRICPQPMKEIKVTTTGDDWHYIYLDVRGTATKHDAEAMGGPLANVHVEDNDLLLDFDIYIAEGSASLSNKSYAVGKVADALPMYVGRVAIKNATPGSNGTIRFMAPYDPTALESK